MGHDSSFLSKLAKKLFHEYISSYIRYISHITRITIYINSPP